MITGFVPPPFGTLWEDIASLLSKAMDRGKHDWSELRELLADGRAQLWLTVADRPVSAMVTRMDGDTFEIWLAGGAILRKSMPHFEMVIEAARQGGAKRGRIDGRKGWERALRPYGWRREGDELVKDF